jgi:hypothetical protein
VELEDVRYCVCEYSQNIENIQGCAGEGVMQPKDSINNKQNQGCLAQEDVIGSNKGLHGIA